MMALYSPARTLQLSAVGGRGYVGSEYETGNRHATGQEKDLAGVYLLRVCAGFSPQIRQ
jgi:hypothetical protein